MKKRQGANLGVCFKDETKPVEANQSWSRGHTPLLGQVTPGKKLRMFFLGTTLGVLGCPRKFSKWLVYKWVITYLKIGEFGVITHFLTIY